MRVHPSEIDGKFLSKEHLMAPYQVKAEWDDQAGVWVASSDDVPGLATGADTFEALIDNLKVVISRIT